MAFDPTAWRQQQAQNNLAHMQALQASGRLNQGASNAPGYQGGHGVLQSYTDPRAAGLMANAPSDPLQREAYAVANHIAPSQLGLTNQQINYAEQGNMGARWDNATGQMVSTTGQPYMANAGNGGGAPNYNVTPGYNMSGIGSNPYQGGANGLPFTGQIQGVPGYGSQGGASQAVSNLGGGAGNPNNAAGGLYGAAGNALRQQFMDSSQFNPNGANTYAIQNMNMSGQGQLGSNMGGMPSNGITTSNSTDPTQTGNASQATQNAAQQSANALTGTYPTQTTTATAGMGTSPVAQQYNTNSGTSTGMTPSYFPSTTNAYSSAGTATGNGAPGSLANRTRAYAQ